MIGFRQSYLELYEKTEKNKQYLKYKKEVIDLKIKDFEKKFNLI